MKYNNLELKKIYMYIFLFRKIITAKKDKAFPAKIFPLPYHQRINKIATNLFQGHVVKMTPRILTNYDPRSLTATVFFFYVTL